MPVRRLALLFLLQAAPAAAEVCDKVAGDGSSPDQGPVAAPAWQTGAVMLVAFATVAFVIVRLRSRALAGIAGAGALALALLSGWWAVFPDQDPIRAAAILEGCVAETSIPATLVRVSFFLTAAAAFLWMARRRASIR
jgi:hypothetical protein